MRRGNAAERLKHGVSLFIALAVAGCLDELRESPPEIVIGHQAPHRSLITDALLTLDLHGKGFGGLVRIEEGNRLLAYFTHGLGEADLTFKTCLHPVSVWPDPTYAGGPLVRCPEDTPGFVSAEPFILHQFVSAQAAGDLNLDGFEDAVFAVLGRIEDPRIMVPLAAPCILQGAGEWEMVFCPGTTLFSGIYVLIADGQGGFDPEASRFYALPVAKPDPTGEFPNALPGVIRAIDSIEVASPDGTSTKDLVLAVDLIFSIFGTPKDILPLADGALVVFENDGKGRFTPGARGELNASPASVAALELPTPPDAGGGGVLKLLLVCAVATHDGNLPVLTGNLLVVEAATLKVIRRHRLGAGFLPNQCAVGDVTGDSLPDVVAADAHHIMVVSLRNPRREVPYLALVPDDPSATALEEPEKDNVRRKITIRDLAVGELDANPSRAEIAVTADAGSLVLAYAFDPIRGLSKPARLGKPGSVDGSVLLALGHLNEPEETVIETVTPPPLDLAVTENGSEGKGLFWLLLNTSHLAGRN